jgi:hypothetical protein
MINIYQIIWIALIVFISIVVIFGLFRLSNSILRLQRIKNFPSYLVMFTYYLDKAWDIIYKDRIFTYSAEGYRLDDKEHDEVMKEYVRLVIKMLGPKVHTDLVLLYGNEDTFIFNVLDYFNGKYEDDEIRGAALDNISNKEEESIK